LGGRSDSIWGDGESTYRKITVQNKELLNEQYIITWQPTPGYDNDNIKFTNTNYKMANDSTVVVK